MVTRVNIVIALVDVDTVVAYGVVAADTIALVATGCFGTSSTGMVTFVVDVTVNNIFAWINRIIICFKSGVANALMGAVKVVASGADCVASVCFWVAFIDVFAYYSIANVAVVAGAVMGRANRVTRLINAENVFTCSVQTAATVVGFAFVNVDTLAFNWFGVITSVAYAEVSNAGINSSNLIAASRAKGTGKAGAFVNVGTDDVTTVEANFGASGIAAACELNTINVHFCICTCRSFPGLCNGHRRVVGVATVVGVDCAFVNVGASATSISGRVTVRTCAGVTAGYIITGGVLRTVVGCNRVIGTVGNIFASLTGGKLVAL
jgi:hypothetical protein